MKTGEKVAAAVGVGGAIAGTLLWVFRAKAAPGLAKCHGTVLDYTTNQPISGITANLGAMTKTTGWNGQFSFENIEPGTYALIFNDSLDRYEEVSMSVMLAAGETKPLGSIQMTPIGGPPPPPPTAPSLGSMYGRVFDARGGAPLASVIVAIDGYSADAVTDSQGNFIVSGLPEGVYSTLTIDGYEPYAL